jgi:hypothetical protein
LTHLNKFSYRNRFVIPFSSYEFRDSRCSVSHSFTSGCTGKVPAFPTFFPLWKKKSSTINVHRMWYIDFEFCYLIEVFWFSVPLRMMICCFLTSSGIGISLIRIENPARCNSVSKFYFIFIWSSTCFGRHTARHQEPKTALAASGFAYVEGCWTCSCWMLSGRVCSKTTSSLWFCIHGGLLDV